MTGILHSPLLSRSGRPIGVHWPGVGRPLLCLHGFGGAGLDFEVMIDSGAMERPIIALDLPGHGLNHAMVGGLGDFERLLREVHAVLGCPFDLLGYSMGGRLALWTSLNMELPLESLTLIGSTPGPRREEERVERQAFDDMLIQRLDSESMDVFMDWWQQLPLIRSQSRMPAPFLDALRARRKTQSPAGLISAIRAFGTGRFSSLWPDLGRVELPTRLIVGEEDGRYRTLGSEMDRVMPRSSLQVIAGSGHAPHLECSSKIVALLNGG